MRINLAVGPSHGTMNCGTRQYRPSSLHVGSSCRFRNGSNRSAGTPSKSSANGRSSMIAAYGFGSERFSNLEQATMNGNWKFGQFSGRASMYGSMPGKVLCMSLHHRIKTKLMAMLNPKLTR